LLGASATSSSVAAQGRVEVRRAPNLSPAAVVERYANALIVKDWATCVSLTDPEELARNKWRLTMLADFEGLREMLARDLGLRE
jgi:hypothetical protein